jgi:3-oxoacyl-[acyl-carrier protein] reductase
MIALGGKTALVTGGSRGIGRATALLLAQAGADVAITYRSRGAEADAVVGKLRSLGCKAFAIGGDHAAPELLDQLTDQVRREFSTLDIFVANAGIWPADDVSLAEMTERRWRETIAANLDAIFLTTRAALRLMSPGGRVVLVSSTAGQRGEAGHADYAATKGGVIALTKSLAIECVAPGWVDTEMAASAYTGEGRERVRRSIPLQRIPPPEDIAGPILFLCSDLARHITGEVVNVNGGSVLCG